MGSENEDSPSKNKEVIYKKFREKIPEFKVHAKTATENLECLLDLKLFKILFPEARYFSSESFDLAVILAIATSFLEDLFRSTDYKFPKSGDAEKIARGYPPLWRFFFRTAKTVDNYIEICSDFISGEASSEKKRLETDKEDMIETLITDLFAKNQINKVILYLNGVETTIYVA